MLVSRLDFTGFIPLSTDEKNVVSSIHFEFEGGLTGQLSSPATRPLLLRNFFLVFLNKPPPPFQSRRQRRDGAATTGVAAANG